MPRAPCAAHRAIGQCATELCTFSFSQPLLKSTPHASACDLYKTASPTSYTWYLAEIAELGPLPACATYGTVFSHITASLNFAPILITLSPLAAFSVQTATRSPLPLF
mmetsp:Transcript_20154/g.52296  ORF Transcript_20154/g.52296 Transcript_20154/m.52296 type:complete len:108 (+) Transcript_20154:1105-1428(+)